MPREDYQQISKERRDIIMERYEQSIKTLCDLNIEPIKVFDPLSPKQIEALELIREVSRDLKGIKEEYMKKMAQAQAEEGLEVQKTPESEESKDE